MKNNHDYNREKLKNSAYANSAYANARNDAHSHTTRPTTGRRMAGWRSGTLLALVLLLICASLASLSIGFSKWNIHVQQQLDVSFTYENYQNNSDSFLLSCSECNHYFYASESLKSGDNCPSCKNGKKLSTASSTPLLAKYVSLQHSKNGETINHDPNNTSAQPGNVADFPQILSNNALADAHQSDKALIEKDTNKSDFFYDSLPYTISILDTTGTTGEISGWKALGISFSYEYYLTHSVVNSTSGYYFQQESKYTTVSTATGTNGANNGVLSAGKYICVITATTSNTKAQTACNQLNNLTFSSGGVNFPECALVVPFSVYPAEGYLNMQISSDTNGTENQSLSEATDTPKSANFSASAPTSAISREGSSQTVTNSNNISVSGDVTKHNENTVYATYNGNTFIIKIEASFNLAYLNNVLEKANSTINFDFPKDSFYTANAKDSNDLDNNTPYTATAKVVFNTDGTLNHDFFLSDPYVKYFILKRPVNVTWENTSFTYDGKPHNPTASTVDFISGDDVSLVVTGAQTNAGTNYTATASIQGDKASNYYIVASGETQEFTINKRIAELSWSNTELTYNGSEQAPTATVTNTVDGDECIVTVTGAQTNAGTNYTATATGLSNSNYTLEGASNTTTNFTIYAAQVSIQWTEPNNLTYDGSAKTLSASYTDVNGNIVTIVNISYSAKTGSSLSADGNAVNAGEYIATASISDSNYSISSGKTQEFTIKKRIAELSWSNTDLTYNGKAQAPTATVTNTVNGDECIVTVSGAQTNAGTNYTATATELSNNNYTLVGASNTTTNFTIYAQSVTLDWANFTDLTYTGQSQSPTASFKDVINETVQATITVTAKEGSNLTNNNAVNAGTYTATASISDSNYTLSNPEKDFTIKKALLTVKANDTSVNMGNDVAEYCYTITGFVDGENAENVTIIGAPGFSSDYNKNADPSNVSDYYTITVNVTNMSAANYYFEADNSGRLTVTKANTVAFPYPSSDVFTFDENVYTVTYNGSPYTLIPTDNYTIEGTNEAQNVGTYSVTVIPINGYTWSNAPEGYAGTDNAYTFTWKITPITVTIEWSKDSITYNGTAQAPTPTFGNVINGDTVNASSYTFTANSPSTLTNDKPVNAGSYTVKINGLSNDNYTLPSDNLTKSFSISKQTLSINNEVVIERDLTKNGITLNTDLLLPTNNGNNAIILGVCAEDDIQKVLSVSFARNCPDITESDLNAGKLYYNNGTNIIHGSTYEIQVVINDDYRKNYKFGTKNGADVYAGYPILKYKTAKVGSTYYTIEDAIKANTGNIILQGGNPYVATCFTALSYYNTYEYTANQNIILPYKGEVTASSAENLTAGNDLVYSVLIIPKGVTLNVKKELNITAYVAYEDYGRACVTWDRGVVMNHGTINVNNGGSVLAYGYLKGNGLVNLYDGATMTDLMHLYGFGAKLALALKDANFFPVQAYMIHNVSCKTHIYTNSVYQVYYLVEAQDNPITGTAPIISNNSNALFQLTSGYVEKYAAKAATWNENDAGAQALYSIEGSNQIAGQRDVVKLHDAVVGDNPLSITIKYLITYTISTSYAMPCPISYMDIVVGEGSTLTLDSSSYKFLAGSSLTVENGAKLTTGDKTTLYFFTTQQSKTYTNECYCGAFEPTDNKDAVLVVNGEANVQGSVTGKIESTSASAKISLAKNSATTVQITGLESNLFGFEANNQQSPALYAQGNVVTSNANSAGLLGTESKTLSSNTTYKSVQLSDGTYAWYTTGTYTITYDTKGGTMPSGSYTTKGTPGQAIGDLPTPERDGYYFKYWTYNDAQVTPTDVFYFAVTFKAEWEVNTYNLVYDLDGVTATAPAPADNTLTYGGTYNGKLNDPTNTPDGYAFVGWYTAKTGGSKLENSTRVTATLQNGAELKIYARWKVRITFNATEGSTFQDESPKKQVTMDRYSTIMSNSDVANLKLNAPDGYLFAGWTDDKTLISYLVEDADTSGITIINDTTTASIPIELYAVWEANKQPVYIIFDYGTKGQSTTETKNSGKLITDQPPDNMVPEGHYFVSWHTTAACTNDDLITNYPTPTEGNQGYTIGNPLTLYAKWEKETYTVILDKCVTDENVSITTTKTTIKYGDTYADFFKFNDVIIYTRNGYTLYGWTFNEKEIKSTDTVPDIGKNSDELQLLAIWKKNYTVRLVGNATFKYGTESGLSSKEIPYGTDKITIDIIGNSIANDTRNTITAVSITNGVINNYTAPATNNTSVSEEINLSSANNEQDVIVSITTTTWYYVNNSNGNVTVALESGTQDDNWYSAGSNITITLTGLFATKMTVTDQSGSKTYNRQDSIINYSDKHHSITNLSSSVTIT